MTEPFKRKLSNPLDDNKHCHQIFQMNHLKSVILPLFNQRTSYGRDWPLWDSSTELLQRKPYSSTSLWPLVQPPRIAPWQHLSIGPCSVKPYLVFLWVFHADILAPAGQYPPPYKFSRAEKNPGTDYVRTGSSLSERLYYRQAALTDRLVDVPLD